LGREIEEKGSFRQGRGWFWGGPAKRCGEGVHKLVARRNKGWKDRAE